jgi:uncharacterized protein involved in exopolysaccharide biosynthesis
MTGDAEDSAKSLSDYLEGLRRRKVAILVIFVTVFLIGLILAFALPPVYRSTAKILIKEQEIPSDLVRSTITTYAWQRVQIIRQNVMTRSNLLEIVERHNLYQRQRRSETSEQIVERMRNDIRVDEVTADVIDPRTGRPTPATIAFTLSFDGENPAVTQKVASELTSLYLKENLKARTEKAAETFDFLSDESRKLSEHIAELESKLADFKEKNVNQLPELANLNLQIIDRTERELIDTQNQIRSLEDRKFYLDGQLAQLSPSSPMFLPTGERILDPTSKLKVLKTELAAAMARYSPDHPDVIRLQHEIQGLELQTGSVSATTEQAKLIGSVRAELAAAREKYAPDHPDVAQLARQLETLEEQLKSRARPSPERDAAAEQPDNPAYISLQAQRESVVSDLRATYTKRNQLKQRVTDYEQRIAQTPQVEREYLSLRRDYENSQLRYREIRAKQMEAEVAQQLEKESKGERFLLIEPAQFPEEPIKPNRAAIVFLALILSLAGGVGYALTAESLDQSVRGARGMVATLGAMPLSVIPYIENSADALKQARNKRLMLRSALVGVVIVVLVVQFFWIPWDVLWFRSIRVLSTMAGGWT